MALIPVNEIKAQNKANGKGEITICHILGSEQLGGNDMFARVTIPAGCSIGYHEHHGNTETYHILQGEALYSDNGKEMKIGVGTTTFCPGQAPMGLAALALTAAPETPQPAHSSQSWPQADFRGTEITA